MMTSGIRCSFSIRALALAIAMSSINIGGPMLLLGWSMPAAAADGEAPPPAACAPLSAAQQHVLEAAANGVGALRNHLWIRRGIRNDDLVDTVKWIDDYRARAAGCALSAGQLAQVEPAADGRR